MPFKPGQSGNPGGRPKLTESQKMSFAKLSDISIERLEEILNGTREDVKVTDQLRAIEIVLDRHLGKPLQAIEAEISDLRPIVIDPRLGGLVRDPNTKTS